MDVGCKCAISWDILGDVALGRPGPDPVCRVDVYRLMQSALRDAIEQELGQEAADRIFHVAGREAGAALYEHHLAGAADEDELIAQMQTKLREMGVGALRMESAEDGSRRLMLAMDDDVDRSGPRDPRPGEMPTWRSSSGPAGAPWRAEEIDRQSTGGRCRSSARSEDALSGPLKAIRADLQRALEIAQRMGDLGELSCAFDDMGRHLADMEQRTERASQSLSIDEERWRLAIECSRDGVFDFDLTGSVPPFFSQRLLEMQGCLPPAPIPDALLSLARWPELIHPEDTEARGVLSQLAQGTWGSDVYDVVFRFRRADGEHRWRHTRGRAFRDEHDAVVRVIGIIEDIHARKEQEDAYIWRATHDGLSGLPNRDFFYQHLERVRGSWSEGVTALLVMIDLDHFKEVNDTGGHQTGDQLLSVFARRLRGGIRDRDVAARFGGDEFALYIECDEDPVHQRAIIERIRSVLEAPVTLEGRAWDARCSMGVSVAPKDGVDPDELMRRADEALYEAKRSGRDTWRHWSPSSVAP